jgi:hypothetical protein
MKTIFVHIWGYKSRSLADAVDTLISNQSGENQITVSVHDQTNLTRKDKFPCRYSHVPWDTMESPYKLLEKSIANVNEDFFMYVNGAISFEENWDTKLLEQYNDKVIISGNHGIDFYSEYKFRPAYSKRPIDNVEVTNWITNDFIFAKTSTFRKAPSISGLKYFGLEDIYSIYAAQNGVSIFAMPTSFCKRLDVEVQDFDYVPFSLNHGYKKVIDTYHGENAFFLNAREGVYKLSELLNFEFYKLYKMPFETDDVSYNVKMDYDVKSVEKFLENIRYIG